MEELFIETKEGNFPINQEIAEEYDLEKGTKAPFTGNRIVNVNLWNNWFLSRSWFWLTKYHIGGIGSRLTSSGMPK